METLGPREEGTPDTVPISVGPATLAGRLGRYRIVEQIGAGGMGVVYRAQDERLSREVALKVLPTGRLAGQDSRQRFSREALLLSQLNHPNIATIYDFDSQEDLDYLVMEYIPGRTLSDVLHNGPLLESEVRRLGVQIAEGLAVAHENGVLHRDLKPGNLRLVPDGRLKILDFGLAKWVHPTADSPDPGTLTESHMVLGTPAYMSPEQLRGEPSDVRADVFALGIVLYEMATGTRPFRKLSGLALMHAIVNEIPPPPRELNAKISPALEAVILKSTEKDPNQRYQTARDVARALEQVDPSAGAAPRRRAAPRPIPKWFPAVAAVAVVVAAVAAWALMRGVGAIGARRAMLAVLPFENLSAEREYFSDGLTEEMISQLGKVNPSLLGVIARTSAMQYKGTTKAIRTIGRELGVQYVLGGSVRRDSSRVRITAQLSKVGDQTQLWSESYDRPLADVLAIQTEVAGRIARALEVELVSRSRTARSATVNPAAHDAYLLSRYEWNRRSEDGLRKAIEHARHAVALDSGYALGYASLADAYLLLGSYRFAPLDDVMPSAKQAAERALELDPGLAQAHASLAAVAEEYDRDWVGAERHYRRAIELDPGYATAHQWYAGFLTLMGRPDDAVRELTRTRELDPRSLSVNADLGACLYYAHRFDRAVEQTRAALAIDSTFVPALNTLGLAEWHRKQPLAAVAAWQSAMVLSGAAEDTAGLRRALVAGGPAGVWSWKLEWLKAGARRGHVSPYEVAATYSALGEKDHALEWLEIAYREDRPALAVLKADPLLDGMRSDPRFADLVRRMRLPPG